MLRAQDRSAPQAVRAWIVYYTLLKVLQGGLNDRAQRKIEEAEQLASEMEKWKKEHDYNKVVQ